MSTRRLLGPLSAPLYSTERSYRSKLDLKGIATAPFRDLDTGETLLLKTDGFVAVFKYAWNGVLPVDLPDAKELLVRLNQLVDEIYAKSDDALLLSDQQYVMSCTVAADEESGLLVSCGIRRMPDVKAVLDALYMYAKRNKVPAGRGIKRAGGTHELPGWMGYDIQERCMRELSAVTEPVFERSDDSGQVVERKRASAEPPRLRACAALVGALFSVRGTDWRPLMRADATVHTKHTGVQGVDFFYRDYRCWLANFVHETGFDTRRIIELRAEDVLALRTSKAADGSAATVLYVQMRLLQSGTPEAPHAYHETTPRD